MLLRRTLIRLTFLFGAALPVLLAQGTLSPEAEAGRLTEQVRSLARRGRPNSADLNRLLGERAAILRRLARANPDAVLRQALAPEERQTLLGLAPQSRQDLEETGTWQGVIDVLVVDHAAGRPSERRTFLREGEERRELHSSARLPNTVCGDRVQAEGLRLGEEIVVQKASVLQPRGNTPCTTSGTQSTAVLMASFPGKPLPGSPTTDGLRAAFFGTSGRSLTGYWNEVSYGRTTAAGDVFGPFIINQTFSCTTQLFQIANAVLNAAAGQVNFANYSRVFIVMPDLGGCGIGVGTMGCSGFSISGQGFQTLSVSWLQAEFMSSHEAIVAVASHEGGHNLGLDHSRALEFGAVPLGPPGVLGVAEEYGGVYSAMGYALGVGAGRYLMGHYGAPHKRSLNWLEAGTGFQQIETGQTVTLLPYSSPSPGVKAVRIRRSPGANRWLWLEYRQPQGNYDTSLSAWSSNGYGGAIVHYEDPGVSDPSFREGMSNILDFTPSAAQGLNDLRDAALESGRTWTDADGTLSISVVSATASGLQVSISYGSTPVISQVTVSSMPAGRTFTVDGGATVYTAPFTFSWEQGSNHTIAWQTPQSGGAGVRHTFSTWSGGSTANPRSVTVGGHETLTGTFATQFWLELQAGAGGLVTPASGFFAQGQPVGITAAASAGHQFAGWTGTGTGAYTGTNANATVVMNSPIFQSATFSTSSAFTPIRINAGGGVYVDPQGNTWAADPGPSSAPSSTFAIPSPILNTSTAFLYQSERWSTTTLSYSFAVPNGLYTVRLKFAEIFFKAAGQRVFNILLNNQLVDPTFDILARAGAPDTALDRVYAVAVTTGQLQISLVPVTSNPKLSALEITAGAPALALTPGAAFLAANQAQPFTPQLANAQNPGVSFTLSGPGTLSGQGQYTAPGTITQTQAVQVQATSSQDPAQTATATVLLQPAWTSQDLGNVPTPGTYAFTNGVHVQNGSGNLTGTADAVRFTAAPFTGNGQLIARVTFPFQPGNSKAGLMFRESTQPGARFVFLGLYAGVVALLEYRAQDNQPTGFQFGAAGVVWLRLVRTGDQFQGWASNDGVAWIPVGPPVTLAGLPGPVLAGLSVSSGSTGLLNPTPRFDQVSLTGSTGAVAIDQTLVSLAAGQTTTFTATGGPVSWSISPALGTINPATGEYTAPGTLSTPQTVTVTATSTQDASLRASVVVRLGQFVPVRVNAGGPPHIDPTGVFWQGDTGATTGNVFSTGTPTQLTGTPFLYQSERFGPPNTTLRYRYVVPPGVYQVTLKWAEIFFTQAGQRTFNVVVNGQQVETAFDVVSAAGGANRAVDRSYTVTVPGSGAFAGAITIDLVGVVSAPKVNAIQIVQP